jgi:hypothetical protein
MIWRVLRSVEIATGQGAVAHLFMGNNTRSRHPIRGELKLLIRRMTSENALWSQRRIQVGLARLGYKVCARAVAKYMRQPRGQEPSLGRNILREQRFGEI